MAVRVMGFSEDDPPIWSIALTGPSSVSDLQSWIEEHPSVRRLDVGLPTEFRVSLDEMRHTIESHDVVVENIRRAGPDEDHGVQMRV